MNNHQGIRTWLEIDRSALKNNYQIFRKLIGSKCKLMAVAKSNAYGHGLFNYALEMTKLGVDFLGVDSITEALALRKEGIKTPILVLGYTLPEMLDQALLSDISLTISSSDQLRELKKFSQGIKTKEVLNIHLKVDTGMHRQGFFVSDLKEDVKNVLALKNINIEGLYTHFAAAKNPAFPAETKKQIEEFKKAIEIVESFGVNPIKHASATGGAIVFPESHFDMVRIGIGLMGLWPSYETKSCYESKLILKPAMTWKTIVSEIKEVPANESIGYDFTEQFDQQSKIAILPIGYWHGYPRSLSSIGHVLIKDQKAKVIGRISMDMIVVDIANIKGVNVGESVILMGKDRQKEISAYDLAQLDNTSWYEIITQINPLIKKFYL